MSEETPAKRGDGAWKEQRDAIAKRNADAQRRGQETRRERQSTAAAYAREDATREAEQLRTLNRRIERQNQSR